MDIDEVVHALGDVKQRLLDLPGDAWPERYTLLKEQDRLREIADELGHRHDPEEGRTDAELRAEAASLRARINHMVSRAGSIVTSKGGGNQSPGSGAMAALEIAGKQQRGHEIDRLSARISTIESTLDHRGTDPPGSVGAKLESPPRDGRQQHTAVLAAEQAVRALSRGDSLRAQANAVRAADLDQVGAFSELPVAVAVAAGDLDAGNPIRLQSWDAVADAVGAGPLAHLVAEVRT